VNSAVTNSSESVTPDACQTIELTLAPSCGGLAVSPSEPVSAPQRKLP
jgi:hypothetical protein